jgi:hypothetical protein
MRRNGSGVARAREERLATMLSEANIEPAVIESVVDSGYYLRDWTNLSAAYVAVTDMMYGNKEFSSHFSPDKFVEYLRGAQPFSSLPSIRRTKVRCRSDIEAILSQHSRSRFASQGSLCFRGQPSEYKFKRSIPNPVRSDVDGFELSVMAGVYRQKGATYSFANEALERRTIERRLIEFDEPDISLGDYRSSYDAMRTEQHYATQTAGLDVTFDVETAIFFATHKFVWTEKEKARYERVSAPQHAGVIYCFRFTMPSVTKTEFLIRDFDFFKSHRPERIIRQNCGLPLIGPYERNVAVPDLDCIIELDATFSDMATLTPEYLFPSREEDAFYARLLELKKRFPDEMSNVVEYEWANG